MLLAIDVGNTNITLGLVRGESIVGSRRAATRAQSTPDELELLVDGLLRLDGASLADVSAIVCASVVPALTATIADLATSRELSLLLATAEMMPIGIRTQRPAEVGADRLVNALAVARLYGTPAIVIDFGTATEFDVVARDGAFIGGALVPGIQLGMEALAARTAKLPRIELREPERAIGTDTVSAMQSGVVLGYRALTIGLLERIREELAAGEGVAIDDIRIVLTGGLSVTPWAQDLPGVNAIDPDLTLKGLAILWSIRGPAVAGGSSGAPAGAPAGAAPAEATR